MSTKREHYLSFYLEKELFAIHVNKVLEVLQKQPITEVPQSADYIKGVINFRGNILPVIEMRKKMNKTEFEENEKYVVIILDLVAEENELQMGIMVDSVRNVIKITEDDIKPLPEIGNSYDTTFIKGMIKTDEGFVMVVDIEKVFEHM